MTTDEKKLLEIERILNAAFQAEASGAPFDIAKEYAKDIIQSLKQFDTEPLEVEIDDQNYVWFETYGFETKQKAIDFCAKHGLRVKK